MGLAKGIMTCSNSIQTVILRIPFDNNVWETEKACVALFYFGCEMFTFLEGYGYGR